MSNNSCHYPGAAAEHPAAAGPRLQRLARLRPQDDQLGPAADPQTQPPGGWPSLVSNQSNLSNFRRKRLTRMFLLKSRKIFGERWKKFRIAKFSRLHHQHDLLNHNETIRSRSMQASHFEYSLDSERWDSLNSQVYSFNTFILYTIII